MIRRATRDDIPAMARIVCDWERAQPYIADPGHEADIIPLIEQAFDAREIYVTGAPVDGYMSLDPAQGKLGAIYLTRPGTGLGKTLIDMAKDGRDFLWLTVFPENTRAFAFYRREGFRLASSIPAAAPAVMRMEWQREGAA